MRELAIVMLTIQPITLSSYGARYANRTKVLHTNSASYVNASAQNSASYVTKNYGRMNEISARHSSANAHDSASYVANKYGRINENSESYLSTSAHDLASHVTNKYS